MVNVHCIFLHAHHILISSLIWFTQLHISMIQNCPFPSCCMSWISFVVVFHFLLSATLIIPYYYVSDCHLAVGGSPSPSDYMTCVYNDLRMTNYAMGVFIKKIFWRLHIFAPFRTAFMHSVVCSIYVKREHVYFR